MKTPIQLLTEQKNEIVLEFKRIQKEKNVYGVYYNVIEGMKVFTPEDQFEVERLATLERLTNMITEYQESINILTNVKNNGFT